MSSDDVSPKAPWVDRLPQGPPDKEALARLVEHDQDEAETEYYEEAADPRYVHLEAQQRRYRGAFQRRLRRLGRR